MQFQFVSVLEWAATNVVMQAQVFGCHSFSLGLATVVVRIKNGTKDNSGKKVEVLACKRQMQAPEHVVGEI